MNFKSMSVLAILSAVIGCDRPVEKSDRKPVSFTLNPHKRTISIGSDAVGPNSKDRTDLGFTTRSTSGARGEWPLASVVYTPDRMDNPQVVVRVFDEDRGAVRVEARFTGPKVPILATIVFPHVSKADRFMLKAVKGDTPFRGYTLEGEYLEVRWPESGDGVVSFLAWPHVH